LWHKISTTGDIVAAADEKHRDAHRSHTTDVFHGTTPHRLVKILKSGGLKDGSVDGKHSHTPWCCMGCSSFEAGTKTSFGMQGVVVELLVYGNRNNYNKVQKKPAWDRINHDEEDWRQLFLDGSPGQFLTLRGTFWMKADATEMRAIFIREDELDALARVSYKRPHRHR